MIASARLVLRNDECTYHHAFSEWCRGNGLVADTREPGCPTFRAGKVRVDFDGPVRGEDNVLRQSVHLATDGADGDVQRLAEVAVAMAVRFCGHVEASADVEAVIDRITGNDADAPGQSPAP